MAESIHNLGIDVNLIEMLEQVLAPADKEMASFLHEHINSKGVNLFLEDGASKFVELENHGLEIHLNSRKSYNFRYGNPCHRCQA